MTLFKNFHHNQIPLDLISSFPDIKNPSQIPKLEKIIFQKNLIDLKFEVDTYFPQINSAFYLLTGQFPHIHLSRKDVSNLALRQGQLVSFSTTLRNQPMFQFYEKLIFFVFDKIKTPQPDIHGNLHFSLTGLLIFQELQREHLHFEDLFENSSFEISLITNKDCDTKEKARILFSSLKLPIKI